jgi:predicted DCC family thiol-disulfide oxidoreductase YuxK
VSLDLAVENVNWTVVFDGECAYCQRQVARIRRLDVNRRFDLTPRQTEGLTARFPQLEQADFNSGMRLIGPEGRVYVGADAVYQIARRLPRWRRVAWMYRLPGLRRLLRAVYAWVAANRHALSGRCLDGTCSQRAGNRSETTTPCEP